MSKPPSAEFIKYNWTRIIFELGIDEVVCNIDLFGVGDLGMKCDLGHFVIRHIDGYSFKAGVQEGHAED